MGSRGTPQSAPPPQALPVPPAGGPPRGGPGGDPDRFAQLRATFCATPEGEVPDLSALPDRMAERLRGPDGQIDPELVKQTRERICNGDNAQQNDRFAATRAAVCADPPNIDALPERMLARLRKEDGTIDQEQLAEMRQRMCSPSAAPPQPESAPPERARGGGGPPGGGFGSDGRGRYFFNISHTIELNNTVLISDGGTLLDLLDGDGASGFGLSRHNSTLEGGFFKSGKGMRISGSYTGPSRIAGGGLPGQSDLRFGSVAKIDLRLFTDLGNLLKQEKGFLDDLRLSLVVDNVFDARRKVTDSNGDTPLSYQKFLVDPTGRYLGIDLRKMF